MVNNQTALCMQNVAEKSSKDIFTGKMADGI